MQKLRIVIALLCITAGIVGTVYAVKQLKEKPQVSGEKTVPANGIDKLTINSNAADLMVKPTSGNHIRVAWRSSALQASGRNLIHLDTDGSTLQMRIGEKDSFFHVDIGFWPKRKPHVVLYVPDKLSNLDITNNVGKTGLSDIQTDQLTITTDVASVSVENVFAAASRIKTSVGAISVKELHGTLDASSDIGSISANMDRMDENWQLSTDIGEINIRVRNTNHTSFIANTDVGDIRVFGKNASYINKNQKHAVEMHTDVGAIRVERK